MSERTWHESQQIKPKRDGSIIFELELGALEEVQRWILSWGSHVHVLAPSELATLIRDEARKIAAAYPPAPAQE